MKNFYTTQILLIVATLFSGVSLIAQPVCNQFNYFYADINYPSSGKQTDIYSVGFDAGVAELTAISEDLPYGGHIAYNEIDKLIYIVNDSDGSIQTLDPATGILSAIISPSISLSQVSAATISEDGKLLIGSHDGNIYQVVFDGDPYSVSVFDGGGDISGGDLVFTNVGLYLASKPNGYLYAVLPGMYNILLGYVTNEVTGLAKFEDGESVIVSGNGNSSFLQYEIDGSVSEINSFAAMLNGEPFILSNGDLTSGCGQFQTVEEDCTDFQYFFIADHTPGITTGTVFGGNIVGGDFVMTSLFESGLAGHIAVNNINGDIYVLRNNRVKTFSATGVLLNNVAISGLPSRVESAVWNPETNLLYVASASANKVYELNPSDGSHSLFASGIPVNGGDLVINNDGELFIVKRIDNAASKLYKISSGSAAFVADVAPAINGAALTADGGFIMAEGDGTTNFHVYDGAGNPVSVLNSIDNLGNPILIEDGDMASGCMSNEPVVEPGCNAYSLFYTNFKNQSSSDIFRLDLNNDNTLTKTLLTSLNYGSVSSAVSPDGKLYISSRFGNGYFIVWDVVANVQVGGNIPMTDESGNNIQEVGGSVFHNGLLYVTSLNGMIYALNATTGQAVQTLTGISGQGSDILFDNNGDLWIIDRPAGTFHNLTDATSFTVSINDIDGIALLANGNFAAANGDFGSLIYEIDPAIGALTGVTFETDITMQWGDLSGICMDAGGLETPDNGECNATEVIEYIQGTSKSGGAIAGNRTDASQALGAPERAGSNVFVSLGYGGSLTLAFNGAIPNGPGDDIEVVETSYGNPSCAAYPEFADVYVSVDGISYDFAKTICRTDGFVDISDAGTFDYVNFVRIVNNNDLSITPDGFDVDGVVAIHNCIGDDTPPAASPNLNQAGQLSVYPNPTSGVTTVEFATVENGKTTLEVLDLNGRVVKTLFSKDVQAGELNKVSFDGSGLPNGIYITKMVTNNETVIDKIMIAR